MGIRKKRAAVWLLFTLSKSLSGGSPLKKRYYIKNRRERKEERKRHRIMAGKGFLIVTGLICGIFWGRQTGKTIETTGTIETVETTEETGTTEITEATETESPVSCKETKENTVASETQRKKKQNQKTDQEMRKRLSEKGEQQIRVLIKTSDYAGICHDSLLFIPDSECVVFYGKPGKEKQEKLAAGKEWKLDSKSIYWKDSAVLLIKPKDKAGRIQVANVKRAQGAPFYRGSFEVTKKQNKLFLINQLPLEQYLYAVLPGEMPASYPQEALKAQAICARTYAWNKICDPGLSEYGADVDDSTSFQVYQNLGEADETTLAAKETRGQVLYYGDKPAETYYYSTSCGYSADVSDWLGTEAAKQSYLSAKAVHSGQAVMAMAQDNPTNVPAKEAKLLKDTEKFQAFLQTDGADFYEKEEPWFRWQYTVEKLDPEDLIYRLKKRYEADPQSILTRKKGKGWLAEAPSDIGKLKNLSILRRGEGGIACALLLEGEKQVILVKKEYNIRAVLCNGDLSVCRQDGSEVACGSLLPSAFFTLTPFKKGETVIGYTLSGGGYGHGVGMSQNGARNMALAGEKMEEILEFFYEGCKLQKFYE